MTNTLIAHNQYEAKSNDATMDNSYLTFKIFCSLFPWPSEAALRAYYFRAKDLGLQDAFVKCGRRVLVKPKVLFSLIDQMGQSKQGDKNESQFKKSRKTYQ